MSTEEKVEMEAVPLKTDTDETKAETAETAVVEEPKKKEAPKRSWLFPSKTEKKKVIEEEKEIEEKEEKPKKKGWWSGCGKKEKKEGENEEEQKPEMSIGIDMQMRDEQQINDHVKIDFNDVFGEPDTFHSNDCIWRANYRVFESTRTFFYKLFAIPMIIVTFIFAILFAFASALNNFIVMPLGKLLSIPFTWISLAWSFIISTVFNPLANSIGLCFSKIHVRKYGINNAPTDLMQA